MTENKTPETNPLDSNYENITNKLSTCSKVIETLDTEGWETVLKPRINNMINEFSGATNKDGLRTKGAVAKSADPYQLATNIGIQLGMENIYNMIVSHIANYDMFKKRLEGMEARANKKPEDYTGGY